MSEAPDLKDMLHIIDQSSEPLGVKVILKFMLINSTNLPNAVKYWNFCETIKNELRSDN